MAVSTVSIENAQGKSLQSYIDETPPRPLSAMQWRIWSAAAMGKFFEGIVVFTTGVALPLIERTSWGAFLCRLSALLAVLWG